MYDEDTVGYVEIYRTRNRDQAEMVADGLQYAGIPVASRRELPEGAQPEDFEAEHVEGEQHVVFVPEAVVEEAMALVSNKAAEAESDEEELSGEDLEHQRARKRAARALVLTLVLPLLIGLLAVVLILVGTW